MPADEASGSTPRHEQRSRTDEEWMQHDTHSTRLGGGCAMPLTLFAQETGAATADARRIDHTQAPVGFSTPLVRNQRLPGRTAQRAIGLGGKVSTREAVSFPEQSLLWWSIPWHRRKQVGSLLLRRKECRGKLGRTHRVRMKLMAQLQEPRSTPIARRFASTPLPQAA
jgi:hypothetical protein